MHWQCNPAVTGIYSVSLRLFPGVELSLPDVQLTPGHSAEPSPSPEAPGPSASSAPRSHRAHRSGGTRDDRYRSGNATHTDYTFGTKHTSQCTRPVLWTNTHRSAHTWTFAFSSSSRHSHGIGAGSAGQAQRRENGAAHAYQETLCLCPISCGKLHTSRYTIKKNNITESAVLAFFIYIIIITRGDSAPSLSYIKVSVWACFFLYQWTMVTFACWET